MRQSSKNTKEKAEALGINFLVCIPVLQEQKKIFQDYLTDILCRQSSLTQELFYGFYAFVKECGTNQFKSGPVVFFKKNEGEKRKT